jgi:hypothetical protein
MTAVSFRSDAILREYWALSESSPGMYRCIQAGISLIAKDPATAERAYSVPLDREHVWLGMPVDTPGGVVAIAWRHDPRGYDAVVITDFTEAWEDLPLPRIWPRPE